MAVSLRGGKQHHLCPRGTFSEWQDLIFLATPPTFILPFFCVGSVWFFSLSTTGCGVNASTGLQTPETGGLRNYHSLVGKSGNTGRERFIQLNIINGSGVVQLTCGKITA